MTLSLDRSKIRVVLLESIHPRAAEFFRAAGYTRVEEHAGTLPAARLREIVADAHLIGIRSRTSLDAETLDRASKAVAVGCFCIGTNQVDLDRARELGIAVFHAPYSNTRSVAELVVAETVLLLRGVPERNALAQRGIWRKAVGHAREARGKTLGIVGYGHIGTQVGLLAESLGMQVLFHDIEAKLALGNALVARTLDELLERADVVTLHVPETPATRGMIGEREIARMRPGSVLLNASRGQVVDVEALAAALDRGSLAGAAVDVFPVEPTSDDDRFESPLRGRDNVILTPHIGGSTVEAQQNIAVEVAEKLVRYSDNGSTLTSVNFPEVALPAHAGKHRLLHIHRNQPGVLARVNDVFSRRGVNVAAQYLQTTPHIGYVVIDVEADETTDTPNLRRELAAVPGTIRTRVLY
jgi:D-3-phosphoglycerate dehydrogenase